MRNLTQEQIDAFWFDGFLVIEEAVSKGELAELKAEFNNWVEESRSHNDDYGETLDGRARFDLQPGHSADRPALRRVQSPEEVSHVFENTMRNAKTVDFCAELIARFCSKLIRFPTYALYRNLLCRRRYRAEPQSFTK